jgi:UPF0755 protein
MSTNRDGLRPRSPAEALEPGRAPQRPRAIRDRREPNRKVSALVRFVSGLLTLTLVCVAGAAGSSIFFNQMLERPGPLEVTKPVAIPKGLNRNSIAERLYEEGVISSPWTFIIASYVNEHFGEKKNASLKYGDYEFKKNASIQEVLDTLTEGKSILLKLTLPEGLTSQQIIERIKADPNLTGEITQIPPEGALMPDTYRYSKGMSRSELVEQMIARQKEVLAAAWEKRQPGLPLSDPQQALVLASIVEKETGRADERDRVAAVFINRLRKNMRLESDPTILYGLFGGAVQWGKPILKSEIEAKNAHNTYQIKGLPPTPICNPGRAAIEATLNPAKTNDLYFVADGNGGHTFSDTLKEHNAAVANWRKAEKEIRAQEAQAPAEAQPATGQKPVVSTVPAAAPIDPTAIPNLAAEQGQDAPPPAAPATAAEAPKTATVSTIPLPVRKPKQ